MNAWGKVNKYRNTPTVVDGVRFASKKEARRWGELQLMERAKYITDLKRQVRFPIDVNGQAICHYVADFTYSHNGQQVVEDAKGVVTDIFRLKKKLMLAVHNIEVNEV